MERRAVSSSNPMEQTVGYSRAVRVGDRICVSGTCAVWPDGSPAMDPFEPLERRAQWAKLLIGLAGAVALVAAVLGGMRAEAIDT